MQLMSEDLFWTGRSCYEEWGKINFFFFSISGMCFKWGVTCWDSFECIYCTCIAWPPIQSFILNRRTSSPAVHCSPISTPAIILYRTVNLSSPPTPPPSLIMIPIIPLDSGLNPLQHLRLKCGLARSFSDGVINPRKINNSFRDPKPPSLDIALLITFVEAVLSSALGP